MADARRRHCRHCKRPDSIAGPISWRGKCQRCALERMAANNLQVSAGIGPFAEHRARRQLMAAQRALVALERGEA